MMASEMFSVSMDDFRVWVLLSTNRGTYRRGIARSRCVGMVPELIQRMAVCEGQSQAIGAVRWRRGGAVDHVELLGTVLVVDDVEAMLLLHAGARSRWL